MNKYRVFGMMAILGIICTLFGAWAKILHLRFANMFITLGMFSEAIGLSALIWFFVEWLQKKNKQ